MIFAFYIIYRKCFILFIANILYYLSQIFYIIYIALNGNILHLEPPSKDPKTCLFYGISGGIIKAAIIPTESPSKDAKNCIFYGTKLALCFVE